MVIDSEGEDVDDGDCVRVALWLWLGEPLTLSDAVIVCVRLPDCVTEGEDDRLGDWVCDVD